MLSRLRKRLGNMIFEYERPLDKVFDIVLLGVIGLSIVLVMIESVAEIREVYGGLLRRLEWWLTGFFALEYLLRVWVARKPWRYVFSFYGLIDFLAILPSFLSLFVDGSQYFIVVRSLRLLRIFRIFKLVKFLGEADVLVRALKASRVKITVFIGAVISLVIILGSLMYLIEGEAHGFDNIPLSIYWAIVTLTTVGYGDISPGTSLGRFLASIIMLIGYGIIAVPTGIVTAEIGNAQRRQRAERLRLCRDCHASDHDGDARFCKWCGTRIDGE